MRVGVISDIHGNEAALDTVLAELARLQVDRVICLGDCVNPLPGSAAVFARLTKAGIPILRGNHEDYVVHCFEKPHEGISLQPNFLPVVTLARRFEHEMVDQLKLLPMTMSLNDPRAGHCLLVHASPEHNRLGFRYGIDDAMAAQLEATSATAIVCGHWHSPETREWRGKQLISNGSVGLPLRGRVEAEFIVLETQGTSWSAEHRAIVYDNARTLREFRESGLIDEGGPSTWFFYEEIRTGDRRMMLFFKWAAARGRAYDTTLLFTEAAREYLEEVGSWPTIAPLAERWLREHC